MEYLEFRDDLFFEILYIREVKRRYFNEQELFLLFSSQHLIHLKHFFLAYLKLLIK